MRLDTAVPRATWTSALLFSPGRSTRAWAQGALLPSMRLDTPVAGTGRMIVLLLSSPEQRVVRRGLGVRCGRAPAAAPAQRELTAVHGQDVSRGEPHQDEARTASLSLSRSRSGRRPEGRAAVAHGELRKRHRGIVAAPSRRLRKRRDGETRRGTVRARAVPVRAL